MYFPLGKKKKKDDIFFLFLFFYNFLRDWDRGGPFYIQEVSEKYFMCYNTQRKGLQ